MISTQDSLLQNNTLGLEFDRLEEVSKFELDAGQLSNTSSYFFVHWSSYLKEGINALTEQFKGLFKNSILISLFG
jgi:hypothetical protein